MKSLGMLLLLALLTACGSTAKNSQVASSPTPTAASPTVGTETLADICPETEAVIPGDIMVPTAAQAQKIQRDLAPIRERGNLEARNALDLLIDGVHQAELAYTDPDPDQLSPGLAASEAFDGGVEAMADRCQAAGSSAFQ